MSIAGALKDFSEKKYYIFFKDGTWRTASNEEWQKEKLWERDIEVSFWAGGPWEARLAEHLLKLHGVL